MSEGRRPQSVLFVCSMNAIRSPMAEALAKAHFGKSVYAQSAGVRKGEVDPFLQTILEEVGITLNRHRPRTLEELDELEGLGFDLIVALAPDAYHRMLDLTRVDAAEVEYWPTPDPTVATGSREQRLEAYRQVRDLLTRRIQQRLGH
ncbi:MAG: low molecular weight phosphatase family protein [Labrys sp. (in: a-proteobacteria)]